MPDSHAQVGLESDNFTSSTRDEIAGDSEHSDQVPRMAPNHPLLDAVRLGSEAKISVGGTRHIVEHSALATRIRGVRHEER
ncbi:hypothetical protein E4U57_008019 [Claviceps arundinis]|uniref:Uncharacterized protein n=1 Tax=Claviceps arundinis TaxID=1623583 RepID=A0ABQ7P0T3_9HYPO|nr:hypothetical protein E4U57_008019 [Claviceps arundinis]